MSREQNTRSNSYHHGDLRNALIIAAAELIEENGSLDFAMIDAARRAGVSSAAPYRHFRDRDALLEAVAKLGFLGLTTASTAAVAEVPRGSAEAIVALGKSYISYMTKRAAFHDLMFGDIGLRAMDTDSAELKTSGFYVLVDAVQAFCEVEQVSGENPAELATKLWAMVHGLSMLSLNKKIDRFLPEADVYQLMESSTATFLAGLRRTSRH
ncbi:TetR/AcrR family transcriptional regulator [Halieaceae bacterium]|nr:TetR/AcrR family transcriptional regulator [Halieaceae bacterium]